MEKLHRSVMLRECLELLKIQPGGTYADMTFGEGGHSEAILDAGAGRVLGVDRDTEALERYRHEGRLRADPRLVLIHQRLSDFASDCAPDSLDGCLVDLGVSTRQLLCAERGFSFSAAGPLDMRMDPSAAGQSLLDVLARLSEEELADALWGNAELKGARSAARRILEAFRAGRLTDTASLARLFGGKKGKSHPATVPFLALRMLVNEEMFEIREGLPRLVAALKPGGRLVALTFHSSEDRAVKRLFQLLAGRCLCEQRICLCPREEKVSLVLRKPLVATEEELARNPRARSAKLRCIEKNP